MEPNIREIPAPPEAELIKLARMAARLGVDDAVAKVRAAGGQISPTYWRDIERGHGGRRGRRVPSRASGGLLAQMAHAVGVTPSQLAGAGRRDAAQVLEEILRRDSGPESPAQPERPVPSVRSGTREAPSFLTAEEKAAALPTANRIFARIDEVRGGRDPADLDGAELFGDDDPVLAVAWDTALRSGLDWDTAVWIAAAGYQRSARRDEPARPGRRSGTRGALPAGQRRPARITCVTQ